MSEGIKEWLSSFSNQGVQIWCEDPETTTVPGVITKTYLTYRILMKQMGRDIVGIRHRYSEFESLRNSLKDKYAPYGILIPSLPPKNSVASLIPIPSKSGDKDNFIKERTLGLTMFCENIVASPWLRNDSLWKGFMIAGSGDADPSGNAGEIRLLECVQQLEIPYKYTMLQRMEDIKVEVLLIEKQVKTMLDRARSVQSCEKALQHANESLHSAASGWLDAERNGVKTLAGRTFDENECILLPAETVAANLSATVALLGAKGNSHIGNPEYTGITLTTILEQEIAMVESFKELFKVHEEIVHSIDATSNKLSKTEAGKASNKADLIAGLRTDLEEKQACLTAFYKGFIYFSLPASAKQRALTIRKLSALLASSHLTSTFVYQRACVDYFKSLNLNALSAINDSSRLLELLGIKPLEKLPDEFGDVNGVSIAVSSGSFEALFQRAVTIGKGKQGAAVTQSTAVAQEAVKVAQPSSNPSSPTAEKHNPLAARRGSAVMANKSFTEPAAASTGGSATRGSSDFTEVQDVEEEDK